MTPKQRRTLDFIAAFIDEHGFSPSLDEIAIELGYSSKSGVSRIIDGLKEQRLISTVRGKARSISIVPEVSPELMLIKSALEKYDDDTYSAAAALETIRVSVRSMGVDV